MKHGKVCVMIWDILASRGRQKDSLPGVVCLLPAFVFTCSSVSHVTNQSGICSCSLLCMLEHFSHILQLGPTLLSEFVTEPEIQRLEFNPGLRP